MLLAFLTLFTGYAYAQQRTPVKPLEPATILKMPKAVEQKEITGKAALPEEMKLGFAMDVDEKVLMGNWNVKATVTVLTEKALTFKTEKGESGQLIYRLPERRQLPLLRQGQPISIKRTSKGIASSLGYELNLSSQNDLILSSGRIFGETPLEEQISPKLSLRQIPERGALLSESKYEKTYQIPIRLTLNDKSMNLPIEKLTEFTFEDKIFQVIVTESSEVIPNKGYEGIVEGKGFTLEYVLVPK